MWYDNIMKKTKVLYIFTFIMLVVFAFSISGFGNSVFPVETLSDYSSTAIENYDDYIDYVKANPTGVNKYIPEVYNLFLANLDEIQTGEFSLSLKSLSKSSFNEIKKLPEDDIYKLWLGVSNCLKFDNPELFYIDFSEISLYINVNFFYSDIVLSSENCYIDGITDQDQVVVMINEMRQARKNIYSQIDESWTDYEIVGFVNDYIVRNVDYDITTNKNFVHTGYGALVNNLAVCDGYSYAVQYLLDGLGISNYVCAGYSYNPSTKKNEGHMWSYVKIYGHWYGLDTTWNDPILSGYSEAEKEMLIEKYIRSYFLMGGNESTSIGFYEDRTVQNYQMYFSNDDESWQVIYELPVSTIEVNDFVNPNIKEIKMTVEKNGEYITNVTINIDATDMFDDMTYAYAVSKDGGQTFGEIISCEQTVTFNNSSQNGIYKFYIISTDGKIVDERLYLDDSTNQKLCEVTIGAKHNITVAFEDITLENQLNISEETSYEGKLVTLQVENLAENKKLQVTFDVDVVYNQIDNKTVEFYMPGEDVNIQVNTVELLQHSIDVVVNKEIEYQLSAENEYFGQTVFLKFTILTNYKIISIEESGGLEILETNENTYQFVMPDRDVEINVNIYILPNVLITNTDVETQYEFVEEDGEYYYLLTVSSLPEGSYIKNVYIYGNNGLIENSVTKISNSIYKIKLGEEDLQVTFELGENAVITNDNPEETNYILIFILFIGAVWLIAMVSFFFYKGKKYN